MLRRISDFFMRILFGEDSLDGYYRPKANAKVKKNYVFSSVFPSKSVMDQVLNQDISS